MCKALSSIYCAFEAHDTNSSIARSSSPVHPIPLSGWGFGIIRATKAMLAASPARPYSPIPKTRHQPRRWCAVVVSANLQRRRQHSTRPQNEDPEEIRGLGHAVLTALKSGPPRNDSEPLETQIPSRTSSTSRPNERRRKGTVGQEEEGGTKLSGSDVLIALQRAASQKRNSSGSRKRRDSTTRNRTDEETTDYSKVRPLLIKSDWGARLDEMENRLRELTET